MTFGDETSSTLLTEAGCCVVEGILLPIVCVSDHFRVWNLASFQLLELVIKVLKLFLYGTHTTTPEATR